MYERKLQPISTNAFNHLRIIAVVMLFDAERYWLHFSVCNGKANGVIIYCAFGYIEIGV